MKLRSQAPAKGAFWSALFCRDPDPTASNAGRRHNPPNRGCVPGTHRCVKSLLPLPERLTKSRHLLTFSGKLRFALQEERVLIRLPKILTVLATLLLAVFAVGAGASTAAAHGSHAHQASINSSGAVVSSLTAEMLQLTQGHAAAVSAESPNELPNRHSKSDCCCGSVMCHAGVTLTVDLFPFLSPTGARLIPQPSSGQPQSDSSGLERPPRSLDIA